MAAETFDVCVAGAGVFGAWAAHALASAGRKVLLLDSYGAANSRASSGGESRVIRAGYGAEEFYTRWAVGSLTLWRELFERNGRAELFRQTGVLWLARGDDRLAADTLATLERLGVPAERLSGDEIRRRFPQFDLADDSWAVLERESGVLLSRRAVRLVVEEARRLGCEYAVAHAAAPEGERGPAASVKARAASIRTSDGAAVSAGEFVYACGPWLPKVFPETLAGRIHPTRQEVCFFGAPAGDARFRADAMPAWVDWRAEVYGLPDLEGRGVKIALDRHGPAFDPDSSERAPSPALLEEMRRLLAERLPALRGAPLVESRVCQYENTSNGDLLIDRHPAFKNVWLVGGGSGHGFKHGPAVGQYVAEKILAGGATEPRLSLATKERVRQRSIF